MLHFGASKLAVLAAVCLLGIGATRSAHAQAYTVTNLGGLALEPRSRASTTPVKRSETGDFATEWSGGSVINLGGRLMPMPPPSTTPARWSDIGGVGLRHRVERRIGHRPRRFARKHE